MKFTPEMFPSIEGIVNKESAAEDAQFAFDMWLKDQMKLSGFKLKGGPNENFEDTWVFGSPATRDVDTHEAYVVDLKPILPV